MARTATKPPPRWVDLGIPWIWQYAPEVDGYESDAYAHIPSTLSQVEGYVSGTSLALLRVGRAPSDNHPARDPWRDLLDQIARYEAEFPARLLLTDADFRLWQSADHPLTWGLLGIRLSDLPPSSDAFPNPLRTLWDRGVRVFALNDADLPSLDPILHLAEAPGPTPIIDLSELSDSAITSALDQIHRSEHHRALLLLADALPHLGKPWFRQFADLHGFLALSPRASTGLDSADFAQAIRTAWDAVGPDRVGLASRFLEGPAIAGLDRVDRLVEWALQTFGVDEGTRLVRGAAVRWLESAFVAEARDS